jgi:DNA polymerase-3 subunit gamma/tau
MPYEITATRKRPQGFEELAGQDFVSATLEASLASGRIAHAYLFSGPRGCGKTSTARILAKALNCEKGPTATPCGACSSCRSIAAGSSLDVIEIDGASNTSVDNVRQIKDEVLFPPNGGRYKVYIIDEVHMLSMSAFNALLKTIEEPPPYVVFIFATTELHKVPATIKSRCQQFAFRLVPIPTIKGLLATAAKESGVEADDDALLWIAKESGGSPRDAYTLFDQVMAFSDGHVTAAKIRDKLGIVGLDSMNGLFEALVCQPEASSGDARLGLEALDAILERGVSPEQLVLDSVEYCRALLLLKNGMDRESLLGASPSAFSSRVLEALNSEQVERALAELLELHRSIRFTVDPRFELELAAARLARLPSYIPAAELARTVASLKQRLAASGAGEAPGLPRGRPQAAPAADTRGAAPSARSSVLANPGADEGEKKKPELPHSLKSAFSSLAAMVGGEAPAAAAAGVRPPEAGPQRTPVIKAPEPPALPPEDDEEGMWEPNPTLPPPAPVTPTPTAFPASAPPQGDDDDEEDEVPEDGPAVDPMRAALDEGVAMKKAVLEAIGRSSPLLGSGLQTSLPWRLEEGRLVIPFKSGIEENVVKGELPALSQVVAKVAGRSLRIELKVAQAEKAAGQGGGGAETAGPEDAADIVAKVFRGQRVQVKNSGGSDGL